MFQRGFCGSWHRTEGHGGVHEQLEALNALGTSTCSALKVTPSTPQGRQMRGEMTTDNSKCEILVVLFLLILQPAKPAWLQCGGHLQAQHLPTHTHRHTPCQLMPRLRPFPGSLSPSSLMTWQTVFEKSLGLSEAASLLWG